MSIAMLLMLASRQWFYVCVVNCRLSSTVNPNSFCICVSYCTSHFASWLM